MVMKNKLLITILLLLLSSSVFVQTSRALSIRLENNPEYSTKVDLVFENNPRWRGFANRALIKLKK
jgi:hypothetical protein